MIISFILNMLIMVLLSYYSKSVPEVFLISIILFVYKKDVNKTYLTIYVLLAGYFTDVFYFVNYPIYTLSYYMIFLISLKYIRDFIIFDLLNLFRIVFVFIFIQKIFFILFSLTINLKIVIYRDALSFTFEMLSTIAFLIIFYKFNTIIEKKKNSFRY